MNAVSAPATEPNTYAYVYNADQENEAHVNTAFTFGAEAPPYDEKREVTDFVFGNSDPPPAYSPPGTEPVQETEFVFDQPTLTTTTFSTKQRNGKS